MKNLFKLWPQIISYLLLIIAVNLFSPKFSGCPSPTKEDILEKQLEKKQETIDELFKYRLWYIRHKSAFIGLDVMEID